MSTLKRLATGTRDNNLRRRRQELEASDDLINPPLSWAALRPAGQSGALPVGVHVRSAIHLCPRRTGPGPCADARLPIDCQSCALRVPGIASRFWTPRPAPSVQVNADDYRL